MKSIFVLFIRIVIKSEVKHTKNPDWLHFVNGHL